MPSTLSRGILSQNALEGIEAGLAGQLARHAISGESTAVSAARGEQQGCQCWQHVDDSRTYKEQRQAVHRHHVTSQLSQVECVSGVAGPV